MMKNKLRGSVSLVWTALGRPISSFSVRSCHVKRMILPNSLYHLCTNSFIKDAAGFIFVPRRLFYGHAFNSSLEDKCPYSVWVIKYLIHYLQLVLYLKGLFVFTCLQLHIEPMCYIHLFHASIFQPLKLEAHGSFRQNRKMIDSER